MRVADLLYLTRPTFSETLVGGLYLTDLGLLLLMGGIWMWLWAEQMKKQPLVPVHDPRFSYHWEHLQHERAHGHGEDHAESLAPHDAHAHGAEVKAHV